MSFFQAILANKKDNLSRMVYADYLEENSKSYLCDKCNGKRKNCNICYKTGFIKDSNGYLADFIRLQCNNENHHRQWQLLVTEENWTKWCWAPTRNEEGYPCDEDNLKTRFIAHPCPVSLQTDKYPYNQVSIGISGGLLHQRFFRGFPSWFCLPRLKDWFRFGLRICQETPVENVMIDNLVLYNTYYAGNQYYLAWQNYDNNRYNYLPDKIFHMVQNEQLHYCTNDSYIWYEDEDLGYKALSNALIKLFS